MVGARYLQVHHLGSCPPACAGHRNLHTMLAALVSAPTYEILQITNENRTHVLFPAPTDGVEPTTEA
jgi:hypothetical protein